MEMYRYLTPAETADLVARQRPGDETEL